MTEYRISHPQSTGVIQLSVPDDEDDAASRIITRVIAILVSQGFRVEVRTQSDWLPL